MLACADFVEAAEVRPGTAAMDYRNVPTVAPLRGFETVVLSARGVTERAKVDSLHAAGAKVLALVQPTLATWHGRPVDDPRQYPWDRALWLAARASGDALRFANGDTAWMFAREPHAAALWDLGRPGMVDAVAGAMLEQLEAVDGIVFDYGCGGPPLDGIAPEVAAAWRAGWIDLLAKVRAARPEWRLLAQCDQWTEASSPEHVDGLLLERVGHSLNLPDKVWQQLTTAKGKHFLLRQEDTNPTRTRLFAAMSLVTGASFNQTADPNRVPPVNRRNPEHWAVALGEPAGEWVERTDRRGVYERRFARGLALVNLSRSSFSYRHGSGSKFVVPPNDGLVLQDADEAGRPIVPPVKARSR